MPLSSSMQISASGLTAQRLHLDVISNNIANANTTRTASGQPYRRQQVVFEAREPGGAFGAMLAAARGQSAGSTGAGVHVSAIQPDTKRDFKVVHDPGHPDADAQGNVRMPNVEPIIEMVDMISATRAYEAGVTAINTVKQMQQRALDIGR
jgi:flagellar basal-body rod protein FlgC